MGDRPKQFTNRVIRKAISTKVSKLRHEGTPPRQAVATALSMARAKRLGPRGGYRRAGR